VGHQGVLPFQLGWYLRAIPIPCRLIHNNIDIEKKKINIYKRGGQTKTSKREAKHKNKNYEK